jgi:hypothetical protein
MSESADADPTTWQAIVVNNGATVDLDVDLPEWAQLELILVDEEGAAYFGRAKFFVGRPEVLPEGAIGDYAIAGQSVDFVHAPYIIPVVPPGPLSVMVLPVGNRIAERLDLDIPRSGHVEATMSLRTLGHRAGGPPSFPPGGVPPR